MGGIARLSPFLLCVALLAALLAAAHPATAVILALVGLAEWLLRLSDTDGGGRGRRAA